MKNRYIIRPQEEKYNHDYINMVTGKPIYRIIHGNKDY